MHRFLSITLLTFFLRGNLLCQVKEYTLADKTVSADINPNLYTILLDAKRPVSLKTAPFKPVKGQFIIYRFIATYLGESFTGKQKEFHDILIVKTNKRNKIITAYQYTLEWADAPEADLYKSTCKDIYLAEKMPIDTFLFKRSANYDKDDTDLHEQAIIRL